MHKALGTADTVWLRRCGQNGWAALGRDTKIMERPDEIAAFRKAKIHIFYYPGNATLAELVAAASATLIDVCTYTTQAGGGAWRIKGGARPHVETLDL